MPSSDADRAGLPRRSPEAISVGHAAMACCGKQTQCVSHAGLMPRQALLSHRHQPLRPQFEACCRMMPTHGQEDTRQPCRPAQSFSWRSLLAPRKYQHSRGQGACSRHASVICAH